MMELLSSADRALFIALNGCHSGWMDQVMWLVSKSSTWFPLYAVLVYWLFRTMGWKNALVMVLMVVIAVGLSDFVASGLIKKQVCRLRPSHDPALQGVVHLVNGYRGGMYGFVSSHAATTMSLAVCLGWLFSKRWLWVSLISWSIVVSYSRVYLGVHYPGDIIGGMIVGVVISSIVMRVYRVCKVFHFARL